jgi:predicted Zn-dependent protease with MMP-like domain
MAWTGFEAPSIDEIGDLAREAYGKLPENFQELTGDVLFMVHEFPSEEVIRDLGLESEFDLLGLYHGSTLADRVGNRDRPEPTMIFLYRRPILDYWAEHGGSLGAIVRHVVVHEIGHHFGLSDADMEAIENEG